MLFKAKGGHLILMAMLGMSSGQLRAKPVHLSIGIAGNFSDANDNASHPYGKHFKNAAAMALEDFGDKLAANGLSIELKDYDYGLSSDQIVAVAEQTIKENMAAVLGFVYSTHVLLVGDTFQKNKTLLVNPTATADRIDDIGHFVKRSTFSDSVQAKLIAKGAKDHGVKKVAIVAAADCAYCQSLRAAFTKYFAKQGGEIVADIPVLLADTDFSTVATALAGKNYDAILVPNYERPSALLIAALIDKGIKPKLWLGGEAWNGSGEIFDKIMGTRPMQGLIAAQWLSQPMSPVARRFAKRYTAKFGRPPVDAAALAYDGMTALLTAVINAKTKDRLGIADAFDQLGTIHGVTGKIVFQAGKTTPESEPVMLFINNGAKKTVSIVGQR